MKKKVNKRSFGNYLLYFASLAVAFVTIYVVYGVWITIVAGTLVYIASLVFLTRRLSLKMYVLASIGLFGLMMLNTLKGVWPMAWRDLYLLINHQTVDELSLAVASDMALFAFIFNPLLNGPLFATIFYLTARPHLHSRLKRIAIVFLFILSSAYPVIEARIDYERNQYNLKKEAERHEGKNVRYYSTGELLWEENWKKIPIQPVKLTDYETEYIRNYAKRGLVPNGKQTYYHENGCVSDEDYYKEGRKEGIWKDYYSNCSLRSEYFYKNDVLIQDKWYYPNGKIKTITEYDEWGNIIRFQEFPEIIKALFLRRALKFSCLL